MLESIGDKILKSVVKRGGDVVFQPSYFRFVFYGENARAGLPHRPVERLPCHVRLPVHNRFPTSRGNTTTTGSSRCLRLPTAPWNWLTSR